MYKIYAGASLTNGKPVGGNVIHDQYRDTEHRIAESAKISSHAALTPDKLTFTLSPDHPHQILEKFRVSIMVFEDGNLIFRGRIIDSTRDFYNRITYTCESDKAFLCDSIMRPFAYKGSIRGFLELCINNHNEMVGTWDTWRNFEVGNITVVDNNDYISRSSETPMSTFKCLNEKLVKLLGGYIVIRHQNNKNYIDYLADFSENSGQVIEFGMNLLDIDQFQDASSLVNCLYPYGSKFESDDSNYKTPEQVVSAAEAGGSNFYHGNHTTVTSANGGVDNVMNEASIDRYGRVWGIQAWDDVTIPNNLLNKAREVVNGNTISTTITVTALDLHETDTDIKAISVGQYVRCVSKPHNVDTLLTCTDVTLDLLNPDKNQIKLGSEIQSLTGSVSRSGSIGTLSGGASGAVADDAHKCDRAIALSPDYTKLVYDERHNVKVSSTGTKLTAEADSKNSAETYVSNEVFDSTLKVNNEERAKLHGTSSEAFLRHKNSGGTVTSGVQLTDSMAQLYRGGAGVTCANGSITAHAATGNDEYGHISLGSKSATMVAKNGTVASGCEINSSGAMLYRGGAGVATKQYNSMDSARMYIGNGNGGSGDNQVLVNSYGAYISGFVSSSKASKPLRIEVGEVTIPFGAATQTVTVAFAKPFEQKPFITTSQVFNSANIIIRCDKDVSVDGFTAQCIGVSQTSTGSRAFQWIAIGY